MLPFTEKGLWPVEEVSLKGDGIQLKRAMSWLVFSLSAFSLEYKK